MDNTTIFRQDMLELTDGIIDDIEIGRNSSFVTVSYSDCAVCRVRQQTIRLVVGNNTHILDERGNRIPITNLRTGMIVNAAFSSVMTRSIPPQATAYMIQIVKRAADTNTTDTNTTIGRIINVDRRNRSFTTINDSGNLSSVIQFNVPEEAVILNVFGKQMNFSNLLPGMRVKINHASFMTASIPPQTTAFEVRVIR